MSKFVIEFDPNLVHTVQGYTEKPLYKVYYKYEYEKNYNCKLMTKEQISKFIENINSDYYDVETNNLRTIQLFGVNNEKMTENPHC